MSPQASSPFEASGLLAVVVEVQPAISAGALAAIMATRRQGLFTVLGQSSRRVSPRATQSHGGMQKPTPGPNPPNVQVPITEMQSACDAQATRLPFAPQVPLHAAVGWPWAGWVRQQTDPCAQSAPLTHANVAPWHPAARARPGSRATRRSMARGLRSGPVPGVCFCGPSRLAFFHQRKDRPAWNE
jgi:hypothetical protein